MSELQVINIRKEVYRRLISDIANNLLIDPLLPKLELKGVITQDERAHITAAISPTDRRMKLFMEIMPTKNNECQRNIVEIFSENNMDQIVDYLRLNMPSLTVQNSTTAIAIWKNENEKSVVVNQLLMSDIAKNYGKRRRDLEKISEYRKELRKTKKALGENHPNVIDIYERLGVLYFNTENYSTAAFHFELSTRSMDMKNHKSNILAVFGLGAAYFELGRFVEAEKLFKQCFISGQDVFDSEDEMKMKLLYCIAMTSYKQRKCAAAEEMFMNALKMGIKICGLFSLETATILYRLANNYFFSDLYDAADLKFKESYEIQEKLKDGQKEMSLCLDRATLAPMTLLGIFVVSYKRGHPIQDVCNRILEMYRPIYDNPQTIRQCFYLAGINLAQSNYDAAERFCEIGLEMIDRTTPRTSENVYIELVLLHLLAAGYKFRNKLSDAMIIYKRTFKKLKTFTGEFCFGAKSIHVQVLTQYAQLCYKMENFNEAEKSYIELLNMSLRMLGLEHADMLDIVKISADYCVYRQTECGIDLLVLQLQLMMKCGQLHHLQTPPISDSTRLYYHNILQLANWICTKIHQEWEISTDHFLIQLPDIIYTIFCRLGRRAPLHIETESENSKNEATETRKRSAVSSSADDSFKPKAEKVARKLESGSNNNDTDDFGLGNEDHQDEKLQTRATSRFWLLIINKVSITASMEKISNFEFRADVGSRSYFSSNTLSGDAHSIRICLPDDFDEIFVKIFKSSYVDVNRSIASGMIRLFKDDFPDASMLSWITAPNGNEVAVEWKITRRFCDVGQTNKISDLSRIYGGFLSLEFSMDIQISLQLLTELEDARIIDVNERARIDNLISSTEKRLELFVGIMPTKNETCQGTFVDILSKLRMDQIADYLRSWIPCLAVRTLMIEPIWKEENQINEQVYAQKCKLINGYLGEVRSQKNIGVTNHLEIINMNIRLGELYYEIENYMESANSFNKSMQIMQDTNDSKDPLNTYGAFSLAMCYHTMAQYPEAERLFEQCLTAQRQLYDSESEYVFLTLFWSARTFEFLSKFEAARRMYQASLEIGRKLYGSVSFEVAQILVDLGDTYLWDDCLEEALSTRKEAYEIQQKIIGSKNPSLSLKIFARMAQTYNLRNDPQEAKLFCNRAFEIYQSRCNNPKTMTDCYYLRLVYDCQSDFDNLERISKAALKILDEKFISKQYNNDWRIYYLFQLCSNYFFQNRFQDVIDLSDHFVKAVNKRSPLEPGCKIQKEYIFAMAFLEVRSYLVLKNHAIFENDSILLLRLFVELYGLKNDNTSDVLTLIQNYCNLEDKNLAIAILLEILNSNFKLERLDSDSE